MPGFKKFNKNQTNGVRIFIFYRIIVQYKAFWSLGFEEDLIKQMKLESLFSSELQFITKHFWSLGFEDDLIKSMELKSSFSTGLQFNTAFWSLAFEHDLWHESSVTGHASLYAIFEARAHFAQRFRRKRLNFSKIFQIKVQNSPHAPNRHVAAHVVVLKTSEFLHTQLG